LGDHVPPLVIARAEGPWQSIGFHPREDVSLPFLPERRMAIPYYRAFLPGLVKKTKCDCPEDEAVKMPIIPAQALNPEKARNTGFPPARE
jgi:hypothetical protein